MRKVRAILIAVTAVMMLLGMSSLAFADDSVADGTYKLCEITSSTGMFTIQQPAQLTVNGENAELTLEAGATAAKRFDEFYLGNYADINDDNKDTIGIHGTVFGEGDDARVRFVIQMKTADIAKTLDFVVRYKKGYSADHDGDWYKSKNHFTMTLGALTPLLQITNNTGMFKADSAYLKASGEEKSLVVALSGNGYENLFKGTYEQAKANGNNTENWIHGSKNLNDKWEFEIPLEAGDEEIAIVSISKSKYQDYLDDKCPIERAFYPRLLVLDEEAGTLVTGDYEQTFKVAVKNNVKMFKPGDEADLKVVGGPNSNNYGGFITLHMGSDSMDCVRAKTYDYKNMELTEGEEIEIPVAEGNIFEEIPVLPALLGDTVTIEFRSKNNGKWYKRDFTLDLEKKEATFDPYAGDVIVQEIAKLDSVEKAEEYARANATPKFTDLLIEAIQVQERDENTDKLCAAAKASWDTLTADEKKEVEEADYFGLDTGDASKDDPLNTAPVKEKELLVVSFGTSFNNSRVATIGAVEKALAKAFPDYDVRRAFTAQIIINHIAARDGEQIDNVKQAMDKAVAAGVKEMIVQPTHLMSGAEYDELKKEIDKYADKLDIKYAKPLLDSDADKELVAKEAVAAAAKDAGYADPEAAIADKDTAFVFMGHGTAHEAKATYTYMQQTMTKLGFTNCFVGTVEGEPEETEVHEILKKVQDGGFKKVILRPLMVVAGDHANNDMAGDEDDSWKSIFTAALGAENVTCQIKGLGEIEAVQKLYVAHTTRIVKGAELEITNNTSMFKVVTAYLKAEGGKKVLTIALSGNGYENLFKGTYEQAKANGNNTESWIHGSKNADDKWEFEIPLEEGEKEIAIVSISKSKYQDYLDDRCPIERAFYPRSLVLDEEAGTLVTGDYEQTFKVAVKNNVKMFKPGDEADFKIVGGPNSNNYGGFITLHMGSDSMDCVRAKTYSYKNMELTEGDEIEIPVAEGNVFAEIPVLPALLGDTVTIEFRSKNNGKWYKRDFTLDLEKKEATFDPYPGDVIVQEIAKLESVEKAEEYARANATPKFTDLLIEAIQVQERDENTDKLCAAAKASWDTLTADEKKEVEEADYFGLDTGDASKDEPLNTAPDKEKELLVVSFGTSFNNSRVATIGAVETALAKAFPDYAVRRAFTAQIIINHIAARDGEQIDNVKQAMDKAVAAGVKEMIVQPTHLMSGAEYDELKKEIDKYADKLDIKYAKPLLDSDADKELVAKEAVAAAAKDAGYADPEAAIADKDTAFVFMGHGTAHEAKATYTYMQQTMTKLGFTNCFVGTVEGEPEETEVHEILKKVQDGGFKKVVLRPLMVVAGDHANNDMAGDEDDSWKSIFAAALGKENVACQIKGLGEIEAVQALYVAHTSAVIEEAEEEKARAAAVEEGNKEAAAAEKIDTSKYSKADAEAITAAIQALKTVIGDAKSTAAQINAAREALSAAIAKADKDKKTSDQIKKVKAGKIYKFKAKAAKKKVTFTWKKNTLFSGYQLKYKVGSKTKVVKIKSAKTVKKVVKKLKKGKKVKAQIRGYKVISGKTYYGKWAKSKTVKVK